jgi:hypothetical protein
MGSAPLVTAVRKNSVGLGERGKGSKSRPAPRSRGLAARPQLGFSTVADVGAEARAVAPRPNKCARMDLNLI